MQQTNIKPNQRKRYKFIEFQLFWEGGIRRVNLQDKFKISLQQATLDLTSYQDFASNNMVYDIRNKIYIPSKEFSPIFLSCNDYEFLTQLENLQKKTYSPDENWLSWTPDVDSISISSRRIKPEVLKLIAIAIRDKLNVKVKYVSLSSETQTWRLLAPCRFGYDGHRWHVRAYDIEKNRYSDFVLSRFKDVKHTDDYDNKLPEDQAWETKIPILLKPHQNLTEEQKKRIEYEYNMKNGILTINTRKSMLFYHLRYFGFNPRQYPMPNESSFSLQIENLKDVRNWLDVRKK